MDSTIIAPGLCLISRHSLSTVKTNFQSKEQKYGYHENNNNLLALKPFEGQGLLAFPQTVMSTSSQFRDVGRYHSIVKRFLDKNSHK